ncbi:MAG: modification methylase [Ignavibacteria bacterium]|nr:modification methylase [Ignavibacteria bacterium]
MLPQIGSKVLKDFNIATGVLLDPYCGSGSSFASGLECGITEMYGYDINPLAILISKAKFTKLSIDELHQTRQQLRNEIFEFLKDENNVNKLVIPSITNIYYWFSKEVINNLTIVKYCIDKIKNENIKYFFLISFSETVRECSYTRNSEFKLYRMKSEDILHFNPDVIGMYFKKLEESFFIYGRHYFPKLKNDISITLKNSVFKAKPNFYDVVLTSPPYGDSKTTVAYGQFSTLSNEWLGIKYARKIDAMLMGGTNNKGIYNKGILADYISQINEIDNKRALEVSAFYFDLGDSITQVANSIKKGGKAIYIVGNRTVKNVQLPTDQFIAEQFEANNCSHLLTYERAISNKAMPNRNSPSNIMGQTASTMLYEYIIVVEKRQVE